MFSGLRALAPVFTLFYVFLFALAILHTHGGRNLRRCGTYTVANVSATQSLTEIPAAISESNSECQICDFIAQPAMHGAPAPALVAHLLLSPVSAPVERAHPFIPFRFCDRSSSRAPPAV